MSIGRQKACLSRHPWGLYSLQRGELLLPCGEDEFILTQPVAGKFDFKLDKLSPLRLKIIDTINFRILLNFVHPHEFSNSERALFPKNHRPQNATSEEHPPCDGNNLMRSQA
jgi:hypothetical protein